MTGVIHPLSTFHSPLMCAARGLPVSRAIRRPPVIWGFGIPATSLVGIIPAIGEYRAEVDDGTDAGDQ